MSDENNLKKIKIKIEHTHGTPINSTIWKSQSLYKPELFISADTITINLFGSMKYK